MAREAGKVTGKVARRTGRREPAAEARPVDARFTDVRPMEMRPVKRDIATPRRAGGSTVGVLLMAATLAAPLLLTASVARAQITGADTSGPLFHGSKAKGSAPPPPSALPGARASKTVAPAAPDATGMDPTAALFDAINRDDVAAARDALSRGAALQADNVLGMTPLQLFDRSGTQRHHVPPAVDGGRQRGRLRRRRTAARRSAGHRYCRRSRRAGAPDGGACRHAGADASGARAGGRAGCRADAGCRPVRRERRHAGAVGRVPGLRSHPLTSGRGPDGATPVRRAPIRPAGDRPTRRSAAERRTRCPLTGNGSPSVLSGGAGAATLRRCPHRRHARRCCATSQPIRAGPG